MRSKKYLGLIVALLFWAADFRAMAQGCSDAGFCTMGSLRPNPAYRKGLQIKLRSAEFTYYLGRTQFDDNIHNAIAEINTAIGSKWAIQAKLPYVMVQGPLANTQGIGDVSLAAAYVLSQDEFKRWAVTLGTKIPTGKVNLQSPDNRALPMYYQTGLGTTDIIGGISYNNRKWMLATGFQLPIGTNKNDFLWGRWNGSEKRATAGLYPRSKDLKRGVDIMMRVERNWRFSQWNFYTGLLPIYRLNKDEFTLPNGSRELASGSDGLAMTALFGAGFAFNTRSSVKALYGRQIAGRYHNPDGLSRTWVSSVTFAHNF